MTAKIPIFDDVLVSVTGIDLCRLRDAPPGFASRGPADPVPACIEAAVDLRPFPAASPMPGELASLDPGQEVHCHRDGGLDVYLWDGMVRLEDRSRPVRAYLCDPREPRWGGTLATAVSHALAGRGVLVLHAAAVQVDDLSMLILGDSGSGKSTLCAAVLHAGGRVLSDDLIAAGCPTAGAPADPRLRPMRRDLYVTRGTRPVLPPHLRGLLRGGRLQDKLYLPRAAAAAAFCDELGVDCILALSPPAPRRDRTRLRPASQAEALAALINASAHLHSSLSGLRHLLLPAAAALAGGAPAFAVSIGSGLLETPAAEVAALRAALTDCLSTAGDRALDNIPVARQTAGGVGSSAGALVPGPPAARRAAGRGPPDRL